MVKKGDLIKWRPSAGRMMHGVVIGGEKGKRWKISSGDAGSPASPQIKTYYIEKNRVVLKTDANPPNTAEDLARGTRLHNSRELKKIKEVYKKLPWSPARRKELDQLIPLAVGANEYEKKEKKGLPSLPLGFILYVKDSKEKKFPYPRKAKSDSKLMVSQGDTIGNFVYSPDKLYSGY